MTKRVTQHGRRCLFAVAVAVSLATASLLAACGTDTAGHNEAWQRQGQLLAWDRDVWIVDATPIVVPDRLVTNGERVLGSHVDATGSIDSDGRMIAEAISLSPGALPESTLEQVVHEGSITSTAASRWTVGDVEVLLPESVTITGNDDVDMDEMDGGGYSATVTGHRFGERVIVADTIEVTVANELGGNGERLRTPVIVERAVDTERARELEPEQPTAIPPAEAEPESPSAPSDSEATDDNERDDDDDKEHPRHNGDRGQDKKPDKTEPKNDKDKKKQDKKDKKDKKDD